MTPEIQIKRPLFQSTRSKYGARRFSHATAEEDSSFIEALAGCAGPDQIKDLRNQQVQRLQYADSISEESPVPQSNRHQEDVYKRQLLRLPASRAIQGLVIIALRMAAPCLKTISTAPRPRE